MVAKTCRRVAPVSEEALVLPATRVVFPEEELNGCYNFDIVENRRTAPGVCGHGYLPVSHWVYVVSRIGLTTVIAVIKTNKNIASYFRSA